MDLGVIQELMRLLEASGLAEMEIEEEGRRIRLSKPTGLAPAPAVEQVIAAAAPAAPAEAVAEEPIAEEEEGLLTIDSPMVGTYYHSQGPGKQPFVLPGDTVEPDQTVCIVEAMKIMNEVVAKFPAVVVKILVDNAQPVEFGQPLLTVRALV